MSDFYILPTLLLSINDYSIALIKYLRVLPITNRVIPAPSPSVYRWTVIGYEPGETSDSCCSGYRGSAPQCVHARSPRRGCSDTRGTQRTPRASQGWFPKSGSPFHSRWSAGLCLPGSGFACWSPFPLQTDEPKCKLIFRSHVFLDKFFL